MGRTFVWICLFAVIVSVISRGVSGCSCFPTHPQNMFCTRDFVFLGKVVSEELIKGPQPDPANNLATWKYRVKLITRMKGLFVPIGFHVQIETPGNDGLCGVRFTVGQKYILSGSNQNGKRVVRLCDLIAQAQHLSFEQMRYLFATNSNSYNANCVCKNIVENDETVSSTSGCKLPSDQQQKYCYFKTALCKRQNGSCKWRNADCN